MKVTFPYPDLPALEIPDENFAGLFQRKPTPAPPDTGALIRESIENPTGAGMGDLAGPGARVLIVVDDISRPTRADLILPHLVESIRDAGVAGPDISFLVAPGSHREMNRAEIEAKMGAELVTAFEFACHDCNRSADMVKIGENSAGQEIRVNRALREADLVVGVGHVAPHGAAGFGGGGKIILPGVADLKSITDMHSLARSIGAQKLVGTIDNPVRREINDAAKMAGLGFIVNVVQNSDNQIVACFAGDPVEAHREAAVLSLEVHGTPVPGPFDIVIIDSHPADLDLWQAGKAWPAARAVVRPGGVVVLVSPCPEGVSPAHPVWHDLAHLEDSEIHRMLAKGEIADTVGAEALFGLHSYTSSFQLIMVSPGISPQEKQHMGIGHADTPALALDRAIEVCGSKATVAVLRNGGEFFPVKV